LKKMSQRELKRMMRRAGISVEPIEGVERVEIHLGGDEVIVVNNPAVTKMQVSGQTTFQVIGEEITRDKRAAVEREMVEAAAKIPEEDVLLVAQQAGVGTEEARNALEMTGGDLAQAILLLRSR
jgi:nascent polypeptide-associated complex subunit alpha